MSERDDSFLYSGLTSASTRQNAEKRAEDKKERQHQKSVLTPAAELIKTEIEKERLKTTDITNLIMDPTSDEANIKALLLAKKMHLEFLSNFQTVIQNVLREEKK